MNHLRLLILITLSVSVFPGEASNPQNLWVRIVGGQSAADSVPQTVLKGTTFNLTKTHGDGDGTHSYFALELPDGLEGEDPDDTGGYTIDDAASTSESPSTGTFTADASGTITVYSIAERGSAKAYTKHELVVVELCDILSETDLGYGDEGVTGSRNNPISPHHREMEVGDVVDLLAKVKPEGYGELEWNDDDATTGPRSRFSPGNTAGTHTIRVTLTTDSGSTYEEVEIYVNKNRSEPIDPGAVLANFTTAHLSPEEEESQTIVFSARGATDVDWTDGSESSQEEARQNIEDSSIEWMSTGGVFIDRTATGSQVEWRPTAKGTFKVWAQVDDVGDDNYSPRDDSYQGTESQTVIAFIVIVKATVIEIGDLIQESDGSSGPSFQMSEFDPEDEAPAYKASYLRNPVATVVPSGPDRLHESDPANDGDARQFYKDGIKAKWHFLTDPDVGTNVRGNICADVGASASGEIEATARDFDWWDGTTDISVSFSVSYIAGIGVSIGTWSLDDSEWGASYVALGIASDCLSEISNDEYKLVVSTNDDMPNHKQQDVTYDDTSTARAPESGDEYTFTFGTACRAEAQTYEDTYWSDPLMASAGSWADLENLEVRIEKVWFEVDEQ